MPKRVAPVPPPAAVATNHAALVASTVAPANAVGPTNATAKTNASLAAATAKPKFTKQQIAGLLRQLKLLFEEGLLTEEFYGKKVAEWEAAQ